MGIFLRFGSIKTIVCCRCVCKAWLEIISDPFFKKLHLSTAPVCILLNAHDFPYSKLRHSRLLELQEGNRFSSSDNDDDFSNALLKLFTLEFKFSNFFTNILGSCNGFLCFQLIKGKSSQPPLYISNPLTGEYMALPRTSVFSYGCFNTVHGFGFSPNTNQYKVIQLSRYKSDIQTWRTHVHTIGTHLWRSIGNFPYKFSDTARWRRTSTYLDGTLNWIANCSWTGSELICLFNLETEQFRSLALLPKVLQSNHNTRLALGVFGDCLCLVYYACPLSDVEIWVLENKNSWIKKVVINKLANGFLGFDTCYGKWGDLV